MELSWGNGSGADPKQGVGKLVQHEEGRVETKGDPVEGAGRSRDEGEARSP